MSDESYSLVQLIKDDPRFKLDAYIFVREALSYAADSLEMGAITHTDPALTLEQKKQVRRERHLTGQQLCDAIRQYAINQFGFMARTVLDSWGVHSTSDFGDIVYNMISVGIMKKSAKDRRSHFDNVYEFEDVFTHNFQIGSTLMHPIDLKDASGSGHEF